MAYWLAWQEPRAVGDLVHVGKFFARNLGGLIRARTCAGPAREGKSRTPSMYAGEKTDEALPSTTSAGSCLPLFGRFLGTTTSSDFSPAYMLGVRLLPSRAGPAHVRARMRPPRFSAKNFPTCTRSPTARGSCHASQYAMEDVAFSFSE